MKYCKPEVQLVGSVVTIVRNTVFTKLVTVFLDMADLPQHHYINVFLMPSYGADD